MGERTPSPPPTSAAAPPADAAADVRALHERCLVADLHTHMLLAVGYLGYDIRRPRVRHGRFHPLRTFTDPVSIEKAIAGGVDLLVFAIYVFPSPWRGYRCAVRRMLDAFSALMDSHADRAVQARSVADVERARREGKLACMLALEGGHALERDLTELAFLRAQGVCYLTLTHFVNNDLSGAATHPGPRPGLTPFGREVIRACEDLGILIDVTHASHRAVREAARLARRPLIYSHTGIRRLAGAGRMTGDDELRMVRDTGGICGLMLSPLFVNGRLSGAGAADLVRALEHGLSVAGPAHLAIGSDLGSGVNPLADVPDLSAYPRLTEAMVAAGLPPATIEAVWGGSFLDLLRRQGW